ncbi:MAG TPA: hypothetical protein VJ865_14110 [Gemmatimonadaceae bacterium]|nr:hypothetical protein [Gemmatimonadaceae bacterium]
MGLERLTGVAAALTLVCSSPIRAQTQPGVTFDQNIISVRDNGSATVTDSAIVHVTATARNIRLDVKGDIPDMKGMPGGENVVMLIANGGSTMTFVLTGEKEYMTFNPLQMMEKAEKLMAGIGVRMTLDTALSKVTFDSLGPGPMIDGHPTLRYRITSRMRMSMSIMDSNTVMDQQSIEDMNTTLDYPDMRDVTQSLNKFGELFSNSFGFMRDYLDQVLKAHDRVRGFPLRVTKQETKTAGGATQKSADTMHITNIRRVSVPDGTFAIPADYEQVSIPLPATADTTSRQ